MASGDEISMKFLSDMEDEILDAESAPRKDSINNTVLEALQANTKIMEEMRKELNILKRSKRKRSPSSSPSCTSRSPSPPTHAPPRHKKKVMLTANTNDHSSGTDEWQRHLKTISATGQVPSGKSDPFEAAEEEFGQNEEDGETLSSPLATFIEKRFYDGATDKKIKSKAETYKRPGNCKVLTAPMTNPEIWKTLRSHAKRTDVRMTNIQKNVAKATIAIARCADKLASESAGEGKEALSNLTDAMVLLGHTHKSLSQQRRDLQRYALPVDFRALCDSSVSTGTTTASDWLYGDDIKTSLKEAREQRRLTTSLREGQKSTYNNNRGHFLGRARGDKTKQAPRFQYKKKKYQYHQA